MKKKILIGLIVVLIGIQFIRPARNLGEAETPQDITHAVNVPEDVKNILTSACYDCHSNHTEYPWYTNINPVGWWMSGHVKNGKEELNFSEFATYDEKKMAHKLEELAEEVGEGHMPIPPYVRMHEGAKLSEAQVKLLVDWANTTRQRFAGAGGNQ